MKKFEFIKWGIYLILGLIPGIVFRLYAQPGASYDAIYSIVIWLSLAVLDWMQLKINSNKEENNENQTER